MPARRVGSLLLLALAALGCVAPSMSEVGSGPAEARAADPSAGFRTREKLADHFRKHGREFGGISMEEYLRLARELRDRPAGGDVLEVVRADRVVTRFDRRSGSFGAYDPDGTIRTFFKPNDGAAYFRRQASREPSR